ncbi:hypothetical protein G7074_02370 [Pedobacter sp. HDW13]|uniref:hypothetical protein n=1 Tax=unclassified Pedobacter TaxID=2628915 RepID=UPI000F5A346E|nr:MULTISPECIES: hypothetical protein [unclassified Pedobacter]QIL38221.1 hypothetical protein G7074_02370 [Pedobacter sp. HDW13]RQO64427.1 hypothetical protein DBR40_25735 [Pedobacter sp. KBW01]
MRKITYNEYLEALEKVNIFHRQVQRELAEAGVSVKKYENNTADGNLISLLQKRGSKRMLYAITSFLQSESIYNKIPFLSIEEVSIAFFVGKYTLNQLKSIRNLGPSSLLLLNKILLDAGYGLSLK